ncbi:T9SS type A sorting domain-containing protein [Winogradskyella sp. F6397]|uniref:T9SS type A sorting domain-containing protein n=1 Tax=Winogradskyella marina TaxID=2785530 RepID=A0ABS0EE53_9FLAO|nr:T9SS type A sorting domain-containing protein [Winogradskyella marina]MBF8148723.1 T9SS type A sorting domain-containing protein [Winogradskyella marina]
MTKQLQLLILLAFLGLGSLLQLNAQTDGTYTNENNTGNGLWTTETNWTGSIIADANGIALIESDVSLDDGTVNVGKINIDTNNAARTISNGTLILNGSADDEIIRQWAGQGTTFDCNVAVNANAKQFLVRGSNNSKLIFAAGNTLDLGSNRVDVYNASPNLLELNGIVTGSGNFLVESVGNNGGMIFGASSDLSGYSGTFVTTDNPIISNTSSIIGSNVQLRNTGSFTINVANTFEGNIIRNFRGTDLISTVTFNASQDNMGSLAVATEQLALDFGVDATVVIFSGYETSGTEGEVDLKNYASGVLRIGTTATEVSQTILDTWLIDGVEPADGTITQDASGYIRVPKIASTTNPSTWDNGSSWIGGIVPTAINDVIIQGNIEITTDVVVNNILFKEAGVTERINIAAGKSLTANNITNIAGNNFVLNSDSSAFSSLIVNGTIDNDIIYDRFVASSSTNDLVSPPVTGLEFGDFSTAAQNENRILINPSDPLEYAFGPFDNATGAYVNYLTESSNNAGDNNDETELISGKGYRAATISGDPVRFNGAVETESVGIAITDETATGTGNYKRWNLIGNPYPSYLDFGAFFTENSDEFDTGAYQAIYGYDGDDSDGSNFTIWNWFNNSDKLAPGQGFFVRSKINGGNVTFNPDMRTIGASDDFIANRTSTPNFVLSELFLSSGSSSYSTKIYFAENQTRDLDSGYDAAAFSGSPSPIYTYLVNNNEDIKFAIQALPYNDFNNVVVPLGITGEAGTQLTIGLNATTATIPSNANVYLEDNETNTWTLLNTGDYVFTPSDNLNGAGRFYIHYSTNVLSVDDNLLNGLHIYSNQSSKTVVVKGQLNSETTAKLYDMQGRMVLQNVLNTSNISNTIDVGNIKTGVYIVELTSNTQHRTQKIIIN